MRRIFMKVAIALLALPVLVALAASIALSTHGGQAGVLRIASYFASSNDNRIDFGPLEGSLFGDGSIESITLSDTNGVWLKAERIAFSWTPSQLVSGRLAIARLTVDRVAMLRMPEVSDEAEPVEKKSRGAPPQIPVRLALGTVEVRTIHVAEAVAGEALDLRLVGSAQFEDMHKPATADLRLSRIDQSPARLAARLAVVPATHSVELAVDGHEDAGGIVARLVGLPPQVPLSLKVDGRGTLDAWAAQLALASGEQPFVAGSVELASAGADTHRLVVAIAGFLETLLPPDAAELFRGRTEMNLAADVGGLHDGAPRSVRNARLAIASDTLHLEARGGADVADRYVYGRAEGAIARADGQPLKFLAGTADESTLGRAIFKAELPDARAARKLIATVGVDDFARPQLAARAVALSLSASQPEPVGGRVMSFDDIAADVTVSGIDESRSLGTALGAEARANLSASFDGDILTVRSLSVRTAAANGNFAGTASGTRIEGTASLEAGDLSRLAGLSGRALMGQAHVDLTLDADLRTQAISADMNATTAGLATGIAAADRLLAPNTVYRGRFEQTPGGALVARDVSIANALLTVALNGRLDAEVPSLTGSAVLSALEAVDPALSGKAHIDVSLEGSADDLRSSLQVTGTGVTLNRRAVEKPSVRFSGRGPLADHTGRFEMAARVGGEPATGSANIGVSDTGRFSISGLNLDIAGAKLSGDVVANDGKLPIGNVTINAANLARVGKAVGVKLAGQVTGHVALSGTDGVARIDLDADKVVAGDIRIGGASARGEISHYLEAPVGALSARVARITGGAAALDDLKFDARLDGGAARFSLWGRLDGGAIDIAGTGQQKDGAHLVEVQSASYTGRGDLPPIRLAAPARAKIREGELSLAETRIGIGGGSMTLSGSSGAKSVTARVVLQNIPASIASLAAPDLGIAGTIDGQATVKGDPAAPDIDAKITARAVSTPDTRANQLPGVDVTATVTAAAGKANIGVRTTGPDGLDLMLQGNVGLKGVHPLALESRGAIPLSLANVFIADRATRVQGTAEVTARISGTADAPDVDGRIAIAGASARDPEIGLDLSKIDADVHFTKSAITIVRLVAASKQGGDLQAGGTIRLTPGSEPFADVSIRLARFKFGNQDPVAAELDGAVAVTGPVSALVATGDVDINRMDITIPNQLPRSVAALDIRHVNAPPSVATGKPRSATTTGARPAPKEAGPRLALNVRAADRIFVRGRGLDGQLGGQVKIRGTAAAPFTDGRFSMSRGRLTIIGRQLDFSRGNIVFTGSPEPTLDMEASGDADGTTVIVTVTGRASEPQFQFSSTPQLPEDEIVSLLLFNKKLAKLSPSQVIQLASEIDKIGGLSSGPSTLDKLKSSVGIDVLDFSTDAKGNAQATVGSYVNDQTYVGVEQGTSLGTGRVVVDHNFTKHLKARGEVGATGDSKLGLGIEWEY